MACSPRRARQAMQDTDYAVEVREDLAHLIGGCRKCYELFIDNIAYVSNEDGVLTDVVVAEIYSYLQAIHEEKHDVR